MSLCAGLSFSDSASAQTGPPPPQVVHAFGDFGNQIGRAGFVKSTNPVVDEIFLSGSVLRHFWQAVRFDPNTGSYLQTYVSPLFGVSIYHLEVGDVLANPGDEIIVVFSTGLIHIHDQRNKEQLAEFDTGVRSLTGFGAADFDNDGLLEFAMLGDGGLHLLETDGSLLSVHPSLEGDDLVIGQMDQDSGLEIAVCDGNVVDFDTDTIQCTWPPEFGYEMVLSDFDADGMEEIIYAELGRLVFAFDVDTCLPKWSMVTDDLDAIAIGDTDGDGIEELLLGESGSGDLLAHDPTTKALLWQIDNPSDGFYSINLFDADGDGAQEILWGAGSVSFYPNRMFVVDSATHTFEWESNDLEGPFLGPLLGDVDGDGIAEVVTASTESEGDRGGAVVVLDQDNFNPIISISSNYDFLENISLYDLDGDGDMEILTVGDNHIEAYDVTAGGNITRILDYTDSIARPEFTCAKAGDIDGDGALEIVAASDDPSMVYVFDYLTMTEEYSSAVTSGPWGVIEQLELEDVDADGQIEIVVRFRGADCVILGPDTTEERRLPGEYLSMEVTKRGVGRPMRIYLGDELGAIHVFFWDGFFYVDLGFRDFPALGILGFHVLDPTRILVSTEQTLRAYHVNTGALLWEGGEYGNEFGRRFVVLDNGDIATAGQYGLYSFGVR